VLIVNQKQLKFVLNFARVWSIEAQRITTMNQIFHNRPDVSVFGIKKVSSYSTGNVTQNPIQPITTTTSWNLMGLKSKKKARYSHPRKVPFISLFSTLISRINLSIIFTNFLLKSHKGTDKTSFICWNIFDRNKP